MGHLLNVELRGFFKVKHEPIRKVNTHLGSARVPAAERSEVTQYYNIGPLPIDSAAGLWHSPNAYLIYG